MKVGLQVMGCLWVLVLMGCAHDLAEQMVSPPNHGIRMDVATFDAVDGERRLSVPVGPPNATLAVWVMEPKAGEVKGTILVLHGFLGNHNLVRGAAEAFVAAGYRAVLVDLRGHGDSTGEHVTFGVVEARDMVQVTDYLVKNKLEGESVGVYGTSLGAAVAIQFAGIDPRVKAVVAVAPFATLREEAPHFGKTMLPVPGAFLSASDYAEVLQDAGQIAGFNPDEASALAAIQKTTAPVLLIHGDIDVICPSDDSRRLHAAAPGHSELVILPAYGHLTACGDPLSEVSVMSRAFFEKHLTKATGK